MSEQITALSAGEVIIDEVILIANIVGSANAGNVEIDMSRIFAEINLFEDLFSNGLYGNILISDSNNLLDQLAIQGLEGLRIKFHTPGLTDRQTIYKTFGVYAISDQQVIMNDRLQTYRLHFASLELLNDAMSRPLNRMVPTKADGIGETVEDIVPFIFAKYLTKSDGKYIPRNLGADKNGNMVKDKPSDLIMGFPGYDSEGHEQHPKYSNVWLDTLGTYGSGKKVRFLAANWTPLRTIAYAVNHTVPDKMAYAGGGLFYESNKAFHYTTVDTLIEYGKWAGTEIFAYTYSPSNVSTDDKATGYTRNVEAEYAKVLAFEVQKNFNLLDNQAMGLFGAQIRSVDPILKRYREHNYSAQNDYENHEHTARDKVAGMFPHAPSKLFGSDETRIDPRANVLFRYREPFFLFDKETEVPMVTEPNWMAQRMARLASLSNYSLQIRVHGRTDIKVGDCIRFDYPNLRGDEDNDGKDRYFNGIFLITAIRHVVTPLKHMMTFEIIKDGLEEAPDSNTDTFPMVNYDTFA